MVLIPSMSSTSGVSCAKPVTHLFARPQILLGSFPIPESGSVMAFVRVKDKDTKHEFDVSEHDPRINEGSLELIKSKEYPPVEKVRRTKYFVASKGVTSKPSEAAEKKEDSK